MANDYMKNMTLEERLEMQVKAIASKEAKRKWANENLKLTYLDEPHWRNLASKAGFRLAPSYEPSTNAKYIHRLLKHIGKDNSWLELHTGCKNANAFAKMEPTWTAFAIQGTLLEDYFGENP